MKKQNLNFGKMVKSVLVMILLNSLSLNVVGQNNNIQVTKFSQGKISLDYERALTSNISTLVGYKMFDAKERKNFTKKGQRLTGEIRMYLTDKNNALSGLYVGPNFSAGRHQVTYYENTNSDYGASWDLIFAVVANHVPSDRANGDGILTANKKVDMTSLGMKLGYKYTFKMVSMDLGINVNRNFVSKNPQGLNLDQGGYADFNSDISGVKPELYLGIGVSF